jgi:hypothetical protein
VPYQLGYKRRYGCWVFLSVTVTICAKRMKSRRALLISGRALTFRGILCLVGVLLPLLALWPVAAAAAAPPSGISQGYETSAPGIGEGALVSLAASGSSQVKPATTATAASLIGIAATEPVLELSGSESSIQVVVSGSAAALVSDTNGAVKAGDKITVSPLDGIGMKAIGSGEVVGTAQKALSSVKTVARQVRGKDGQAITVHIGLLPVAVNVVYYSASSSQGGVSAYVPPFLQSLANTVAGKAVSPFRVLVGSLALLLGFSAAFLMLYVAIRNGVVSLGRNPLAESALRRGIVDVLIGALSILVVTGVVVAAVLLV